MYRTSKKLSKFPAWYNKELINDIKLKNRYLKLYKSHGYSCYQALYRELRVKVKKNIKLAYEHYIKVQKIT